MKTVHIKLFGSMKEFAQPEVVIPAVHTVSDLRLALTDFFQKFHPNSRAVEILKDCAFADERAVLSANESLEDREWIAVLPPVCGG